MPFGACRYQVGLLTTECTLAERLRDGIQSGTAYRTFSFLRYRDIITRNPEHVSHGILVAAPFPERVMIMAVVARIRTGSYRRTVGTPIHGLTGHRYCGYVAVGGEPYDRRYLSDPYVIDLRDAFHRGALRVDALHGAHGFGFVLSKEDDQFGDFLIGVLYSDGIYPAGVFQTGSADVLYGLHPCLRGEVGVDALTEMECMVC